MSVDGYSNEDFRPFFKEKIDKKARIKMDKWRCYIPLKEAFKIKQVYSKSGQNLKELHNFIMNIKGWMRGIHHKLSPRHLQGYLDEFCFRFNYKFSKKLPLKILIEEMVWTYLLLWKESI
jgi:hypothetical protein